MSEGQTKQFYTSSEPSLRVPYFGDAEPRWIFQGGSLMFVLPDQQEDVDLLDEVLAHKNCERLRSMVTKVNMNDVNAIVEAHRKKMEAAGNDLGRTIQGTLTTGAMREQGMTQGAEDQKMQQELEAFTNNPAASSAVVAEMQRDMAKTENGKDAPITQPEALPGKTTVQEIMEQPPATAAAREGMPAGGFASMILAKKGA